MKIPDLPGDILHLLCEELADQRQFDTLFNCACASRKLAVPALTHLYRSHHESPVRGGGDDIGTKLLTIQRWSILWKSIIASSFEATLFPYCRYIKTLDFRDLGYLLDEDQFRIKVSKQFFSGLLKQFEKKETYKGFNGKTQTRLKNAEIIDAIGEVVTQHTLTFETISGDLRSDALVRWTPRLPRLQSLELWDGKPLEDELVHASIHKHCPLFNSLMIFTWNMSEDRDRKFSKFISSMRANTLKSLQTIRDIGAGGETFLSLSHHGKSLEDLRICVSNDTLPFLSSLQGCKKLNALRIEDIHGTVDLETHQHDVFIETIAWLRNCQNLQRLSFSKFQSGAAIITPVLLEPSIALSHLEVDSYVLKDHRGLHQALVHQKLHLKELSLSGETDGMFRDDLDILVDSLKQLDALKRLTLLLPEVLRDEHVIAIIKDLAQLEVLYVSGLELNDIILESIGNLPNLRDVTLSGISKFTVDGLLDFVSRLGPGNQGIRVTIDMADPDTMLAEESQGVVKDCLTQRTGGTLEYAPSRDPGVSEYEGESD